MAIRFEWYENPAAPDKPEEKKYHARTLNNGRIDTKEIREEIQMSCSLTETDVSAVLDALSHIMGKELANGKQVHLDGIGYFRPTLTCTEEITEKTVRRNSKVRLKSIRFRADQKLKNAIGPVKMEHSKYGNHSRRLTEMEIDLRLKKYFSTHNILLRRDFQDVCGMVRSTAMSHLRRLRKEGKLQNIGSNSQPLYVPAPGHYGMPEGENLKR